MTIQFNISSGTRKQRKKLIEDMEGEDGSSLSTCVGRSFCIILGGGGIVLSGGVTPYDVSYPCDADSYSFSVSFVEDEFQLAVSPGNITDEVRDLVFEDNIFIMDADYTFPEWACDEIGVESCVLPAGTYPVSVTEDDIIFFNF